MYLIILIRDSYKVHHHLWTQSVPAAVRNIPYNVMARATQKLTEMPHVLSKVLYDFQQAGSIY